MELEKALRHGDELDLHGAELSEELKQVRHMIPHDKSDPLSVFQFLKDVSAIDLFPNLWVALRILLTLPVSVASGERSFSKLKIIKNYLRSSMTDERLTSLSILSIERDVSESVDFSGVISEFAEIKARKVLF